MDTSYLLLWICVALVILLILFMISFGVMVCMYLRLKKTSQNQSGNYNPSYNLEYEFTNVGRDNDAFSGITREILEANAAKDFETTKMPACWNLR